MAVRVTQHNGRAGKHGVYLAKHNDRQFDLAHATHIDAKKSADNVYWSYYDGMTFEDCERKYYDARFGPALNLQNEKYAKRRQYVYMRTMDEYIANEDTCPEETVIYIGDKDDHVDVELLKKITTEQIEWERKTYPNVVILDYALHVDEEGAPHYHKRQVWEAADRNGNMIVSQTKALKAMGIGLGKKGTRYDNAKQVYTAQCRAHFEDLCRSYGVEVNTERLHKSKTGLAIDDYRAQQAQERLAKAEHRVTVAEQRENAMLSQISLLEQVAETAQKEAEQARFDAEDLQKKVQYLEQQLDKLALIAEPKGYVLENSQLQHCIDLFDTKAEDAGFFGKKGTYTFTKSESEYICNTLKRLEYTTRDIEYLRNDREKKEALNKELSTQKQKLEIELEALRNIRDNVGPKIWAEVEGIAKKVVAQKEAIRYAVKQKVRANTLDARSGEQSIGD